MIAPLLDHLWQSSLCMGLAGLMALALGRNSATVRFWVWFAASLKFLVPFAVLTALGAYALAPMVPPVAVPTVRLAEPLAKPFSAPAMVQITARLRAPSAPLVHPAPPVLAVVLARPVLPAHVAPPVREDAGLPALPAFHLDLESTLLALWAAGFLMLAIRWLVRWSRLRALLRDAVEAEINAPVAVKFSASRLEPGLVGILNPVILLPQGIDQQLSPTELKAVLAHELGHWRRHDNLLAAIHMLVEALFWFFPLVWWIGARLNAEREHACDEGVLADGNDPQIYAEGILKICRAYLQSPLACVAGVSGANLGRRIRAIMENGLVLRLNAARKFVLSAAAATAVALPVALGLLTAPVVQMQARAAQILSPIARRIAEQAPSAASIANPFTSQATADPVAPLVPQAAAPVAKTTAPDPSGGDALTRQEAETPVAPLPNSSSSIDNSGAPQQIVSSGPPVRPLPKPASALMMAANDQPSGPAQAMNTVSCAAPKLLNSLTLEPTPGGDTMTVAVAIDGRPHRLLVGIGDLTTQLWDSPAAKLDLAVLNRGRFMDAAGRFSEGVARVEHFSLGNMETGNFEIAVRPDPDVPNAGYDGVLATNMMQRYDIDLDFAHRQLNYFSPEQCQGAGIYWSPSTISSVNFVTYSGVVYVPVTLDGHTIIALLDTTVDHTFLNPQVAERLFGLKADGLDSGDVIAGGARLKAGTHRFNSLSLGGLTFNNPQIAVPVNVATQDTGEFHASRVILNKYPLSELLPPMIIGMDVLKQSHLYISFRNQRIYVSPAGDGRALQQQAPTTTSWFNVWRRGYDAYLPYLHKLFGL